MLRKSSLFALVLSGSVIGATAEESSAENVERGPLAVLKRTWTSTVNGVEVAGKALTHSVVGVFKGKPTSKAPKLDVKLTMEPQPISLVRDRQVKAVLRLFNNGKQAQVLQFNTTQRADAVIHDVSGKIVARASEDRQFANEPALVTVNPGERLEFELNLATRQLAPGKTYTLEAAVVNQEGLRSKVPLTVLP
jgi:hypothetical protein